MRRLTTGTGISAAVLGHFATETETTATTAIEAAKCALEAARLDPKKPV
jgi:3-oxoacyl-[acyl-carrier-protein] synthase III